MQSSLNPGTTEVAGPLPKFARAMAAAKARAGQACARVKDRASNVAQLAVLAPLTLLGTSPVFAGLPKMPAPGTDMNGDTVQDGDWLGYMSAYYKLGIAIVCLVICALGFIYVMMGAMDKWKSYGKGQAAIGDLKEYMIAAAVLVAFMVMMGTYALTTTGNST